MLYISVRLIHLLSMAFWLSSYVKELGSPLVFEGDKEKDSQLHARRLPQLAVRRKSELKGVGKRAIVFGNDEEISDRQEAGRTLPGRETVS